MDRRGTAIGALLLRVEMANLFAVLGVETIDEFAEEIVDHDGGGVIARVHRAACNRRALAVSYWEVSSEI